MKYLVVAGALALVAGTANAGDGCFYGNKISAEAENASPIMALTEEAEAERLAKLKLQQEQASLEQLLETPVIHN